MRSSFLEGDQLEGLGTGKTGWMERQRLNVPDSQLPAIPADALNGP
jgi:hypothetical protein